EGGRVGQRRHAPGPLDGDARYGGGSATLKPTEATDGPTGDTMANLHVISLPADDGASAGRVKRDRICGLVPLAPVELEENRLFFFPAGAILGCGRTCGVGRASGQRVAHPPGKAAARLLLRRKSLRVKGLPRSRRCGVAGGCGT